MMWKLDDEIALWLYPVVNHEERRKVLGSTLQVRRRLSRGITAHTHKCPGSSFKREVRAALQWGPAIGLTFRQRNTALLL